MTDSTQPQDVAGDPSGTGQGMPAAGRASPVRDPAQATGHAPWRTLPPAEPWRSAVPHAPEPRRSAP